MAGWIKLWRKLLENGHLKMPGMAFKLWIYCLLEAAPYPDPKTGLAVGELWLSYQGLRENLGEGNRKVSMSTVSAALKYLEQNGYLTLQSEKFKGIKAKVINWGEYQALTYKSTEEKTIPHSPTLQITTPPLSTPQITALPSTTALGVAETVNPTMFSEVESDSLTTYKVAVNNSAATLQVTNDYSQNSKRTTPTVIARTSHPYNHKASRSNKNTIENAIKNINSVVVVNVAEDFVKEFGRPLSPIETKQLVNWQQTYSEDLIKEALTRASLQDKRSIAYVGGILKNWSKAGITTIDETLKEPTKPHSKGGKRNARSKPIKPGYHPHEVDWAKEPDTL